MANSQERKVWRWLVRVFFDHHVMVKIPVTRFTMPRAKENSEHWYQMLSGVYCTFTVCGMMARWSAAWMCRASMAFLAATCSSR